MAVEQVVPGAYMIGLGIVNAYLVESEGGLTLIDTGVPDSEAKILAAIREVGREPNEVERIVVTHLHADHSGSLTALKEATGAPAAMHPLDARMVERGEAVRPAVPGPGLINQLLGRLMRVMGGTNEVAPAAIEEALHDGEEVWPGGLQVFYAPGHTVGQVALLLPASAAHGAVLFVADAASNMFGGLGYAPIYENLVQGKETLRKLAGLEYEVACFGHGGPIRSGAAEAFRGKWG